MSIASRNEKTAPIANVKNAKADVAEASKRGSPYQTSPLRVNHTAPNGSGARLRLHEDSKCAYLKNNST